MGCTNTKEIPETTEQTTIEVDEIPDIQNAIDFIPTVNRVYVFSVHDGDTYWVSWNEAGLILKTKIRLYGCNCPEIPKGKKSTKRKCGFEEGYRIADYVQNLIENKWINVKFTKPGSYPNRFIAKITLENGESLTDHLLKLGYAKPFMLDKEDEEKYIMS